MKKYYFILILLSVNTICRAQSSLDNSLNSITTDIQEKLKSIGKKKIAVLDITDINKASTNTGKYMADVISVNLINNPGYFQVVDRASLDQIMKEQRLNYQGYIDATTAKQIGKIFAVDAIVTGTYTVLSNKITITLKVLDSETALAIAASMKTLSIDADAASLLGINYAPSNDNSNIASNNIGGSRGFNTPVQSGENYNNPSTVNSECANKQYGDYCFYNDNDFECSLDYVNVKDRGSLFANKTIIIRPKQTVCLYQLSKGVFEYTGRIKDTNESYGFRDISGQFIVEQCKSKTYTIAK
jgi:TolB-like protein